MGDLHTEIRKKCALITKKILKRKSKNAVRKLVIQYSTLDMFSYSV